MNDFEDRLRAGLRTAPATRETDQVLAEVKRGAVRRHRRRAAALAAATAVVVAGAIASTVALTGGRQASQGPDPAPEPTLPALPRDAARGVIDVSAAAPGAVYRLTTNVGCVACSTVWRETRSAGGWQRLHDFGAEAYGGRPDPMFGPVERVVMDPDGDGWAWGRLLLATHDGGRTWDRVTTGPGRTVSDRGYEVVLTSRYAWALDRSDSGTRLWRSELATQAWTRVAAPGLSGVTGITTTGDQVVLETSDEGLANPRVERSTDGTSWTSTADPCSGEPDVQPAGSSLFLLCPSGAATEATPSRSAAVRELTAGTWSLAGQSHGVVTAVKGIGDRRLLVVHEGGRASLFTAGTSTEVDLGLEPGEEIGSASWNGEDVLVCVFGDHGTNRLIRSSDGGRAWSPSP
ncbi:MAG: hypothetical protein ACJ72E_03520 [Marmoricola sp.]